MVLKVVVVWDSWWSLSVFWRGVVVGFVASLAFLVRFRHMGANP
jgi:hypothetical protein